MGFFRSPYLFILFILLLVAVIALTMITSPLSAVYLGSVLVVVGAAVGYETLRRRRLNSRNQRSDTD